MHNSEKQLFFIDALDNNDLNNDSLTILENETIEELNRGYYYLFFMYNRIDKIFNLENDFYKRKIMLVHKQKLYLIIYYIHVFYVYLRTSYCMKEMNFINDENNILNLYHNIIIRLLETFQINRKSISSIDYISLLEKFIEPIKEIIDNDIYIKDDIDKIISKIVSHKKYYLSNEIKQEINEIIEKSKKGSNLSDSVFVKIINKLNNYIDGIS